MKKILLVSVYTLIITIILSGILLLLSTKIDVSLYGYKLIRYNHELDKIFHPQIIDRLSVKYTYKSGERGAVYYVSIDTFNIAVIEASNFQNIELEKINIGETDNIKPTQSKTYSAIINDPFPLIQMELNPRESMFLRILFENTDQIKRVIKNKHFRYISGTFKNVIFSNTQNCSIISLQNDHINEILIIKQNDKLFFILESSNSENLLRLINPSFLIYDQGY